jgi:Tol biopolymer transport system component
MKRFDRFVIIFLAVLLGLVLLLVLQGDRVGVQVSAVVPAEGEKAGIYGPIGITFAQSMDQASVESHFSLSPEVPGQFEWKEDTLRFFPDSPLDPDQNYQLSLSAGAKSANGRDLLESLTWSLAIRSPDILYLVPGNHGGELWRWDTSRETKQVLTDTGSLIIDYATGHTGEWIACAAENEDGGSDLWRVNRNGTETVLILACGMDYCSQPDWSMDGDWIAYTRQAYNIETGQRQASRVWTVNVESKETTPLYQNEDALGQLPSFSPDGQKIASYDTTLNGIRVLDLETAQENIIPSALEEMGDWSADGKRLLFIDLLPSALEPEVTIYVADLENETIQQTLNGDAGATSFSQPRWSPDGDWLAVSLRPINSTINKALWVLKLDGSEAIAVTRDPSANFSSYQWEPWGMRLVYQRFSNNLEASVWIWDLETGESQLLIDGAARPQWLP